MFALSFTLIISAIGLGSVARGESYTEFDVPGAWATLPVSINSNGDVTEIFRIRNTIHGFIRFADGTIATFDPGAHNTYAQAINGQGSIVGTFFNHPRGRAHGFLRLSDGTFITIRIPNAQSIWPSGINVGGEIVGEVDFFADAKCHGFVRKADGSAATFDVPNSQCTQPFGINKWGAVTGAWSDGSYVHGFVRNKDGTFAEFDVHGATGTVPLSIDNAGRVIGYFNKPRGAGAFIREPDGKIVKIELSGAVQTYGRDLTAQSNGTSTSVGSSDANSNSIGFVRSGAGKITSFKAPGSGTSAGQGTIAMSINGEKKVTGYVIDDTGTAHGFIRKP